MRPHRQDVGLRALRAAVAAGPADVQQEDAHRGVLLQARVQVSTHSLRSLVKASHTWYPLENSSIRAIIGKCFGIYNSYVGMGSDTTHRGSQCRVALLLCICYPFR